jgi:hypothetical protein
MLRYLGKLEIPFTVCPAPVMKKLLIISAVCYEKGYENRRKTYPRYNKGNPSCFS